MLCTWVTLKKKCSYQVILCTCPAAAFNSNQPFLWWLLMMMRHHARPGSVPEVTILVMFTPTGLEWKKHSNAAAFGSQGLYTENFGHVYYEHTLLESCILQFYCWSSFHFKIKWSVTALPWWWLVTQLICIRISSDLGCMSWMNSLSKPSKLEWQ